MKVDIEKVKEPSKSAESSGEGKPAEANEISSFNESSLRQASAEINQGSSSLQAANKKRVQKARITADFLRKLPDGITYHESDSSGDDEPKQVSDLGVAAEDDVDYKEGDIVRVGKFRINLEKVTKAQLISMRKYLPPT